MRSVLILAAFVCLALDPGVASAQPSAEPRTEAHVEPPPAPDSREPELNVEVRLGAVIPLERTDICPGDSRCVLDAGGSFGIEIERRWPIGIAVSVSYGDWFVDSGGVFELGVVQIIRAAIRYVFAQEFLIHPSVHIGAGALVFGDTWLVSTVGGAIDAGVGAELELTDSVALTTGAALFFFTTSPFTTGRDRIARSEGLGLNLALEVTVGLSILAASGEL